MFQSPKSKNKLQNKLLKQALGTLLFSLSTVVI